MFEVRVMVIIVCDVTSVHVQLYIVVLLTNRQTLQIGFIDLFRVSGYEFSEYGSTFSLGEEPAFLFIFSDIFWRINPLRGFILLSTEGG